MGGSKGDGGAPFPDRQTLTSPRPSVVGRNLIALRTVTVTSPLTAYLPRLDRDLFIVDQHAADEKTNFERLATTLVLNRQPLMAPKPIPGLTPLDESIIRWAGGSKHPGRRMYERPREG